VGKVIDDFYVASEEREQKEKQEFEGLWTCAQLGRRERQHIGLLYRLCV